MESTTHRKGADSEVSQPLSPIKKAHRGEGHRFRAWRRHMDETADGSPAPEVLSEEQWELTVQSLFGAISQGSKEFASAAMFQLRAHDRALRRERDEHEIMRRSNYELAEHFHTERDRLLAAARAVVGDAEALGEGRYGRMDVQVDVGAYRRFRALVEEYEGGEDG